jgi:hypothetical protein
MSSNGPHPLKDKVLLGINVSDDRQELDFLVEDGDPVHVYVEGDCCSTSWVEDIELPALGFPAKVLKVEDLDLPPRDNDESKHRKDTDVVAYYGLKITTDKGDIVIDYRNDSNGYYGGSLVWPNNWYDESRW